MASHTFAAAKTRLCNWALKAAVACAALAALTTLAYAQTTSTGTDHAVISLDIAAELPAQVALVLNQGLLTFDLTNRNMGSEVNCLLGDQTEDGQLGDIIRGSTLTAPAGITYLVSGGAMTFSGGTPRPDGALLTDSHEVCFKEFELEAFANVPGWQLQVDRIEDTSSRQISNLYLGAACGDSEAGGFHNLQPGSNATLMNSQTNPNCQNIQLVLGIKPASEATGVSFANIRYTLVSVGDLFRSEQP